MKNSPILIWVVGVLYQVSGNLAINLALNKPAYQLHVESGGLPARAVDGDIRAAYKQGSCTHTKSAFHSYSWFAVDLGQRSDVASVEIFFRHKLTNMTVNITDTFSPETENFDPAVTMCIANTNKTGAHNNIQCSRSVTGRYVVIVSDVIASQTVVICEVKVYHVNGNELAHNKPAYQKGSSKSKFIGYSVDNDMETCVALMVPVKPPWWVVDLESQAKISHIHIVARSETYTKYRFRDVVIHVGNFPNFSADAFDPDKLPVCYQYTGLVHYDSTTTCDPAASVGRYVSVSIPDAYGVLSICEVEVYGVIEAPPDVFLAKKILSGKILVSNFRLKSIPSRQMTHTECAIQCAWELPCKSFNVYIESSSVTVCELNTVKNSTMVKEQKNGEYFEIINR